MQKKFDKAANLKSFWLRVAPKFIQVINFIKDGINNYKVEVTIIDLSSKTLKEASFVSWFQSSIIFILHNLQPHEQHLKTSASVYWAANTKFQIHCDLLHLWFTIKPHDWFRIDANKIEVCWLNFINLGTLMLH